MKSDCATDEVAVTPEVKEEHLDRGDALAAILRRSHRRWGDIHSLRLASGAARYVFRQSLVLQILNSSGDRTAAAMGLEF